MPSKKQKQKQKRAKELRRRKAHRSANKVKRDKERAERRDLELDRLRNISQRESSQKRQHTPHKNNHPSKPNDSVFGEPDLGSLMSCASEIATPSETPVRHLVDYDPNDPMLSRRGIGFYDITNRFLSEPALSEGRPLEPPLYCQYPRPPRH